MIPGKMARNRWRGILRFGIFNAINLKREIKRNKSAKPLYEIAVCAIAKNEGEYFKEWLDWHIGIGVEKFFIYDNESTDETREILKTYIERGLVEYVYYPGHRKQLEAYDECLKRYRFDTRWLAFIDLDEFIVPEKGKKLPDILRQFADRPLIEVNWICYGSGGQRNREPGKVMERFTYHSNPDASINRHVKSIVNPRRIFNMIGCHEASRIDGKGVDGNGEEIKKSWKDRTPVHSLIKINHYAVKSYEEFLDKRGRGRASGTIRELKDEYFRRFDLNDLQDE